MKITDVGQHQAPPFTPTAKSALQHIAGKLRKAGATVPLPPAAKTVATTETLLTNGLSIALCLVEVELDTLATAAPRDNPAHAALFCLPPASTSIQTGVELLALPGQKRVTGDTEVDAVLWLREVISTGRADLIEKAYEAAARLKSPLPELEKRYTDHLMRTNPGNWVAGMASLGFADLTGLALRAITRNKRQHEARARFGDAIFDQTQAEWFCNETLAEMPLIDHRYVLQDVDMMFDAHHDQRPGTLLQCVLELEYWNDLYWLRDAVGSTAAGDYTAATSARQDYVFRMMSRIPPRGPEEAANVLHYLASNDGMDRAQTGAILMNLVGAPEPYHPHKVGGDHA